MRKLTAYFLTTLILLSCGTDKEKTRITGHFENYKNGEFYLIAPDVWNRMDTIQIKDGKFDFERDLKNPCVAFLLYPNLTRRPIILEPGKKIKIEGNINQLGKVSVTGTDENDAFTELWLQTSNKKTNERKKEFTGFIQKNPDRYASLAAWFQLFHALNPTDSTSELYKQLKKLSQAQPHNQQIQQIAVRLTACLQYGPGNKMPEFRLLSLSGDSVSNRTLNKNPYLVYFWSSWNSHRFNNLRALASKYADQKKQIGFVCIAVDYDSTRCVKTLRYDSLPGQVICDGMGWDSPIVTQIGQHNVPGNVLVDSTGTIVGRDLSEKKLEELLKKMFP